MNVRTDRQTEFMYIMYVRGSLRLSSIKQHYCYMPNISYYYLQVFGHAGTVQVALHCDDSIHSVHKEITLQNLFN